MNAPTSRFLGSGRQELYCQQSRSAEYEKKIVAHDIQERLEVEGGEREWGEEIVKEREK